MNMQPEDREKYQSLKQKLTEAEDRNLKNAVQSFWTLPKDEGMSIRDYASRLLRLLKRFAEDTDPQEVLQKVLRERVIQVLPKEAKAFVRNREPQTVSAACSLAEQYFANDEKDLTSWDSRSSDDSQPYRKQHRERGRQQHYQQDNNKWQHNQKKQPEQTETKTPSKQGDPSEQSHQKQGGGQQQKWRGSGYKDRRGDRNSDKPQGSKEKSDKVVCQLCKGNGHVATDCPTRVNVVSNLLEPPHINLPLVNGTVNTKHVADILLDTGASFTLVAKDLVEDGYKKTGSVTVRGVTGQPKMYPTTTVALGIGKQIYFTRAAVADREDINLSAIVGHNIPGTTLVKLLAETSTPTAGTTPDGDQQDKNLETPCSTPLTSPGPTLSPTQQREPDSDAWKHPY